jgi:hypothetical protein
MENQKINRVEAEMLALKAEEDRFKKIFSFDMSSNKALLREKLRDYEKISIKYGDTSDPEERRALIALKQERKHIEKQAYTNRFVRLFRKVFINPIRRYIQKRDHKRLQLNNHLSVTQQLDRVGMSEHINKVAKKMQNGEKEFSVPVSYYVNENKRVDNNLAFEQNGLGEYKLVSNNVRLNNEAAPDMNRQQTFKLGDGMSVDAGQSYNLLEGRAVQRDGKWITLDLNDRDTAGNFRIKEFPQSYGYDLQNALNELPIAEMKSGRERDKLVQDLKDGKRREVTIENRKCFVEANPQFRTVNIYDEKSQRLSKAELQGNKTLAQHQSQKLSTPKAAKRSGVRVA